MSTAEALPALDLGNDWPDSLFVLKHPTLDRWGAHQMEIGGGIICGIACFSTQSGAAAFRDSHARRSEHSDLVGAMHPHETTFDEAREIAKRRPSTQALILLDNLNAPEVHYVQ